MARYKAIDTSPRFLAVDMEKQLLPGSFVHAVHHLLEHELDLSCFDTRYRNDQSGACINNRGLTPIVPGVAVLGTIIRLPVDGFVYAVN